MSDVSTPAGWQPDPYGRYAQRYWDGAAWTEHVTDASGTQSTDAPTFGPQAGATSGAQPAATARSTALPVPGIIVVGAGTLLILLSYFVLDWFKILDQLDLDFNDVRDSLSRSSDVPFFADQYTWWGWYLGIALIAVAAAALFVPALRLPVVIAAGVLTLWHLWAVWDLSRSGVSAEIGAWLGALGLIACGVAALLPRPSM